MEITKEYDIQKDKIGEYSDVKDTVVVEYPFTLFLNDKEFITLLCSPKSLKSLAIGFLNSEGIIDSKEDINDIKIDEEKGQAYIDTKSKRKMSENINKKKIITSGCGKGITFYDVMESFKMDKINNDIRLEKREIFNLMKMFNEKAEVFLKTGGTHSCALCSKDKIIIYEEDIGRHNAVDKVLGKALLEDISLEDKIILTSGRVSTEILIKILKRKIPILISRSAPTNLAVEISRQMNILLIGFARGKKMNVYSKFDSIVK